MSESATPTRVEKRMRQTASGLTSVSRRFTAERGLAGFTIEEVCDSVGVSRRTFFNYFASKEDAVIGANPDDEYRSFAERFLARGAGTWPQVLTDLIDLAIEHVESNAMDPREHTDLMAALEREPRLLARFIGMTRDRDRQMRGLIAERQGVGVDDPRAVAIVSILATLMKASAETLVDPSNDTDFATILTTSLDAMRLVLAVPTHH
ncbi:TetR/AcrR family transcriptional regulator [Cryobacterium sp. PAMC25264]|uniref:TetR/AcrR family transcriptional regulator n=1 Tax=Cryobacterium sp. PAMC25264 TaxID=2861288 RepID=UPI001C639B2A|nr:TetR/AcrR family transcriptional regulator [Cryobacterium sp. PAMC25264]QYF72921.1 TetR/AcrR family transcriptional regulator; helix-turn-helix transcriptional regulator [Cryobacterium sp. PAMC25264]